MADLRVTIVTPSFQHDAYIEQTLLSVLEQDYPFIEYIVMDGGSTDTTVDILKRYEGRLKWISEKDAGQADAINKGFALASGDIFGWVNSDDYYAPGAIAQVAQFFSDHPDAAFVYGDVIGLDNKDQQYGVRLHIARRQGIAESDFDVLVNRYDFLVQPGCFWRASVWREVGELDITLRYTMDYEYWMRIARHHQMHYLPVVLAYERLYGEAKTGSGSLARIEEIEAVARRHGGTGLPYNYRAEAAANYTVSALKHLFTGKFLLARQQLGRGFRQKAPLKTYLRYLIVMLLFGEKSIPTAWLWINRLRSRRWLRLKSPASTEGASSST